MVAIQDRVFRGKFLRTKALCFALDEVFDEEQERLANLGIPVQTEEQDDGVEWHRSVIDLTEIVAWRESELRDTEAPSYGCTEITFRSGWEITVKEKYDDFTEFMKVWKPT